MTVGQHAGWCASWSEMTNPLDQSTLVQLESGVRRKSHAPFGAGERPQGPTYRYIQTQKWSRLRYTPTMIRKRYTPSQKAAIVLELLKEEDTLPQIASRHSIDPVSYTHLR